MKCRKCSLHLFTKETREVVKDGYDAVRRRKECANKHAITTYEVEARIFKPERNTPFKDLMELKRLLSSDPRPPRVIGPELGLAPRRVSRIRRKAKEQNERNKTGK